MNIQKAHTQAFRIRVWLAVDQDGEVVGVFLQARRNGPADWFNNRRLLEPIGNIPPVEYELMYYRQLEESA